MRELTYAEAIREAFEISLRKDPSVMLMGLGIPDPKGYFGTTLNLQEKFGANRVMDMPCSENGMTGIALGAALNGLRPVINHQRVDFALLAMDQMCTQAAKWSYMFSGAMRVPLVMRMIMGRGWGQGPQHSQCLHSWFAHIPGLKVLMPVTPHDAKGMLIAAIEDDNPVVFLEHRWLHHVRGEVPEGHYSVPLGPVRVARAGTDLTIVAFSYMVLEALEAASKLAALGIQAEVIDCRCLRPLDHSTIIDSVKRTGRLIVADTAWAAAGMSAEIIALVAEQAALSFKSAPRRVCFPDCPTPTSAPLSEAFYPRSGHILAAAREVLGLPPVADDTLAPPGVELDKPNPRFHRSVLRSASPLTMSEINLLDCLPQTRRDVKARATAKSPEDRAIAKRFDKDFFDGERRHGYGGYRYDGRWLPVARRMVEHYGLKADARILDVGAAKGFLLHDFLQVLPAATVRGIDVSSYARDHAYANMGGLIDLGSAETLPYPDHSFDFVVSINSIHNLPLEGCKQALREIQRVSRGPAFITVDAWRTEDEHQRLLDWILTAETYMAVDDWISLFSEVGYKGDYFWFIP